MKFTTNSEYLFFKILNYDSFLNNIFIDYIKQSSDYFSIKNNGNILVKNLKLTPIYITYIRNNCLNIKYISQSGFIFIKKGVDRNRKYLLYKKIFIYNNKGNLIPGVLIPTKKKQMKIDIGTKDLKEVYSLGINLGAKVVLQEDFSIFNKYLLSNEITNKIGLFILWELLSLKNKRKINFMLIKDKNTKLYFMNYLSFLRNNKLKIIDLFLKKPLGCELIDCCKTNHIKIQILKTIKKIHYIININIKYLKTPIEMILKSEIEKIINLIIILI
ncbi:M42 family Peptidase [Candidatus Karelsulcia muelleri]|nr:M42 family Peptidase [Candidatus Karelsulcia muelleri]